MSKIKATKLNSLSEMFSDVTRVTQGGMSNIYTATQKSLDRSIVLKELKPSLQERPEVLARFAREAKVLGTLVHQNLAHVHDLILCNKKYYISMEHIKGIDLSDVIEKIGPLPFDLAASVFFQVCQGVHFLHLRGYIHRDIKPSNIRLTHRGEVKLMDFGIVYDLEDDSLTRPGTIIGSPAYLSPEQVSGHKVTHQSDIFMLGILLYEILSGTRPFQETEELTIFQSIREVQYTPLDKMRLGIPKELREIVEKSLKKEPHLRFTHAFDLVQITENYLGSDLVYEGNNIISDFLIDETLLENSSLRKNSRAIKLKTRQTRPSRIFLRKVLNFLIGFCLGFLLMYLLYPHIKKIGKEKTPKKYSQPKKIKKKHF